MCTLWIVSGFRTKDIFFVLLLFALVFFDRTGRNFNMSNNLSLESTDLQTPNCAPIQCRVGPRNGLSWSLYGLWRVEKLGLERKLKFSDFDSSFGFTEIFSTWKYVQFGSIFYDLISFLTGIECLVFSSSAIYSTNLSSQIPLHILQRNLWSEGAVGDSNDLRALLLSTFLPQLKKIFCFYQGGNAHRDW